MQYTKLAGTLSLREIRNLLLPLRLVSVKRLILIQTAAAKNAKLVSSLYTTLVAEMDLKPYPRSQKGDKIVRLRLQNGFNVGQLTTTEY